MSLVDNLIRYPIITVTKNLSFYVSQNALKFTCNNAEFQKFSQGCQLWTSRAEEGARRERDGRERQKGREGIVHPLFLA